MQSGGGKADSSSTRALLVIWAPIAQAEKAYPLVAGSRPAFLASGTCVSAGSLRGTRRDRRILHLPHPSSSPTLPHLSAKPDTKSFSSAKKKHTKTSRNALKFSLLQVVTWRSQQPANSETWMESGLRWSARCKQMHTHAISLISCLTPSSLDSEKQEVRGHNNWKHLIFHHFKPWVTKPLVVLFPLGFYSSGFLLLLFVLLCQWNGLPPKSLMSSWVIFLQLLVLKSV